MDPTLIDLSNYQNLLVESTASRTASPPGEADGNIFFDTVNGKLELITKEELPQVSLPVADSQAITCSVAAAAKTFTRSAGSFLTDGFAVGNEIRTYGFTNAGNNTKKIISDVTELVITVTLETGLVDETGNGDERIRGFGTLEDNPLTNRKGIFIGAVYAFERLARRYNEFLRQYDFYQKGTFKFAGAYELVNGRLFSTVGSTTTDDRAKLRGSGWLERNIAGAVTGIYFGARSLGVIEETSQPYYQLADGGEPFDFKKDGPIDEAILVTAPANFLSNKVRTYGYNYDEKRLGDSGIAEMSGYSAGFAIGEGPHLTTDPLTYPLADVYGPSKVPPWTEMHLDKLVTPRTETGFNEGDGDFTWVLTNLNGTLDQCVAFLDALAQTDEDINSSTPPETKGKRVSTWYTYDAAGKVITRSGADTKGLFIENIPTADRQRIKFTADDEATRSYPFMIQLNMVVGPNASADPNGWYHVWKAEHYGEPGAETVLDSAGEEMKGPTQGTPTVSREYDWAGGGSVPLDIVVEVEGDGVATQAKTEATITESAVVSVVCSPGLETNM